MAILIPVASRDKMEVICWNTTDHPIETEMIGMEVLGGKVAPATQVALLDAQDRRIATATTTPLAAPHDLLPSTLEVRLAVPAGVDPRGCSVVVDPGEAIDEIYESNNRVRCNVQR